MNSSQLNFLNRYEKRKYFDVGENGIPVSKISKKLISGISGILLKDESPEVKERFACLFAIQNTDARYITALIPETVKTITSVTRLSDLPENEQIAVKEATGRDFAFLAFKAGKIMQRKTASSDLKRFASFFYNPKAAKNLGAFLHLPEDADNIFIVNGSIVVVALYGYDNIQDYENRFGKGHGAGAEASQEQGVSDGEWQDYHPFQDYIADDENFNDGSYQPEDVSCTVPESDVRERSGSGEAGESAERADERSSGSSSGHNESSEEFNLNEDESDYSSYTSDNGNEGRDAGGSEYSETQDVSEEHSEIDSKSGCLFPFGKNGGRKSGDQSSDDAADSEKSSEGSSSGNGNSSGRSGDELSSNDSSSEHGGAGREGQAGENDQDFSLGGIHSSDDSSRQFSGNADADFEASSEFGDFGKSSDSSEESDSENSSDSEKSSDSDKSSEFDRSSDSDKSSEFDRSSDSDRYSDSDESYDSDQSSDSEKSSDSGKSSDSDSSSDTDISRVSDESSESSEYRGTSEDNSQTVIVSEKETPWWKGCLIALLILLALLLIIALIYWLLCLYVWKTDPAQIFISSQKPETVVVEKGGDSSPVLVNSDGNQPASVIGEIKNPGPEHQQGIAPSGNETSVPVTNENASGEVIVTPASELSPAASLNPPVSSLTDEGTRDNVQVSDSSGKEMPVTATTNENAGGEVIGTPASELSPEAALKPPVSSLTDNSTQSNAADSDISKEYTEAESADYSSSDLSRVREFDEERRSRDAREGRDSSTGSSENSAQDAASGDTASGSDIMGAVPVSVPDAKPEESSGTNTPVPENPQVSSSNKGIDIFEWRAVTRGKTIDGKTGVDFNLTSRDKRISCNSRGYLTRNEALKADEYEVQKVLIGRDCGRFDLDYMPQKITCYDKEAPFCQINSFSESKARSGKEDNLYLLNPYLKMNR